ncbi:hypothetical protein H6P81_021553 [Aristolochia fimbriata]|uniref:Uncharacterized protein n=1 Tax=Aristolochia fimbriata TaxID=158543 RepID=A0AAV7DTA3_ARIFI|nr:hypothetical protein H6P81_021553 [Aristolochia fimbriata]
MGTFFPYHYITYGNRHAFGRICENGSIMKSMAMVDFFIENKGKLQLKQQDIINHTKVGKCVNFLCKWELSSHIITLPMEADKLWSYLRKWVDNEIHGYGDFFIENKRNFLPISLHYLWKQRRFGRICENGSIMKSMAMVDFFIENKGTFFPYHYITYGNRLRFGRICENGSIMKSMAMVDFFIENKRNFLPISLHYLWKQRLRFWSYICENGFDNEIHGYNSTSSLKIKGKLQAEATR